MKTVRTLLSTLIALSLSSCSDSPSASQARTQLENKIQQQSNGLIRLVSFDKTDGKTMEFGGMKGYEMMYTAEIEFLDDCLWSENTLMMEGIFSAVRGQAPASGSPQEYLNASDGMKPVKKGDHFKFTGRMNFEKTESGWH